MGAGGAGGGNGRWYIGFRFSQISTSVTWLGIAVLLTYFGVVMIDKLSAVGRGVVVAVGGGGASIVSIPGCCTVCR